MLHQSIAELLVEPLSGVGRAQYELLDTYSRKTGVHPASTSG